MYRSTGIEISIQLSWLRYDLLEEYTDKNMGLYIQTTSDPEPFLSLTGNQGKSIPRIFGILHFISAMISTWIF